MTRDAEDLLRELGVTDPEGIDLNAIAYHCDAVVRYEPLDKCEARLIGVGGRANIVVNSQAPEPRQRFSIGHELGHWMSDRGVVSFLCEKKAMKLGKSWSPREDNANRFAAELLLPKYLVQPRLRDLGITIDTVVGLADAFTTSLTATAVRIVDLGIKPSMVVFTAGSERLWYRAGGGVPKAFRPHPSFGSDAGLGKLLTEGRRRTGISRESADVWLDIEHAGDYEVVAQSVQLNGDVVMTTLWWEDETQILDALDEE